jgi:hypothetical protein
MPDISVEFSKVFFTAKNTYCTKQKSFGRPRKRLNINLDNP